MVTLYYQNLAIMEEQKSRFSGKKVLIVDDEEINHLLLQEMLSDTGIIIKSASTGKSAVDIIQKDRDFDLVLMDIKMPEMNGFEATLKIKEINKKIPVIIQTAYAKEYERDVLMKTVVDDFVPKPIRYNKLISKMEEYIHTPSKAGKTKSKQSLILRFLNFLY